MNRDITLLRTAIRTVTRTISAQKVKKKLQSSNELLNIFVNLGTDVLSDQLEKSDLRLCFFFPQKIYAQILLEENIRTPLLYSETRRGKKSKSKKYTLKNSKKFEILLYKNFR